MIGNNRHSDRTFVSEHICGRLAPSAEPADARFLSRVLPRHPRALSFSLALSRSLSVSGSASLSRAPSSLFHSRPAHSLARDHPVPLSAFLPRSSPDSPRVSLLSRPYRPPRSPLFSPRLSPRRFSFGASLSSAIRNHPLATRSVLVESPPPTLAHCIHLHILLARALHPFSRCSAVVSVRLVTTLYFCITPSRVLPLVPPRLFRS